MIGKVSRGSDTAGLLRYLFGPGRANEHAAPHLVAAWDDTLVATHAAGDRRDQQKLARLLDEPATALPRPPTKAVWHASLRTAPGDRRLSDAEWAQAAREVVDAVGLAPRGDEDACRWVGVRHAEDHIHLAVTLARQDGRPARTSHDYVRLGRACQALEARLGLTVTAARDRTAPRAPSRAEQEKALRAGAVRTPREVLRAEVRVAAAGASDFDSFTAALGRQGVLVKARLSTITPGEVTGYAVAWPGDHTAAGGLVWFGGARLAPDLSLPRLTRTWPASEAEPGGPCVEVRRASGDRTPSTAPGRGGSPWAGAARASARAVHLLEVGTGRHDVAVVIEAASALLVATARTLEGTAGGRLTDASRTFERAAAGASRSAPAANPAAGGGDAIAHGLRVSARLITASGALRGSAGETSIRDFLQSLAILMTVVARHHASAGRLDRARAARAAAEHVRAAQRHRLVDVPGPERAAEVLGVVDVRSRRPGPSAGAAGRIGHDGRHDSRRR